MTLLHRLGTDRRRWPAVFGVAAGLALLLGGASICLVRYEGAAQRAAWMREYRRPAAIPYPADDPYTPAKAALGAALFFDSRLSEPSTLACAGCHNPPRAWGDGRRRAIGVTGRQLAVRTPTLLEGLFTITWRERRSPCPAIPPPMSRLPGKPVPRRMAFRVSFGGPGRWR